MATFYSQGSGNWSTLANWDTNAGGGGTDPASVAAMDDQTFVIQAGHNIVMDVDISGHTNGVAGLTITSHATDPGMLRAYGACGAVGLKIKTGTTIVGTNAATKGRILSNLSGVWGETGALAWGNSFLISLNTTAYIDTTYLDISLYDAEPTYKSVETYATKYTCTEASTDVAPATDLITFAEATPPAAGTPVMVKTGGVLPGGLTTTDVYYVRSITDLGATFTCKLALQNNDTTLVNITSAGSGALYMYSGHSSTSTAVMNVLTDVTGDAQWASGASVVLADGNAPGNYDQQRVTISGAPTSTQITLSANVDSAKYPLAKIFLMTRNVAVRSSCVTAVNIVSYPSGATHGGVFQCEIRSTAGTGTTFYGTGINYGTSHTVSGTVSGCNTGINYGTSHTVSGTVSGCSTGINYGTSHTVSGTVSGCSTGIYSGTSHTVSGTVSGCSTGINYGTSHTVSGTVSGCSTGINYGTSHTVSGTVSGCSNGIRGGADIIITGVFSGNTYDFLFQSANGDYLLNLTNIIVRGKATITPTYANRNSAYGGDQGVYFENYGGSLGSQYAALAQGDVTRVVTPLRSGGADTSIEVVPLSSLAAPNTTPLTGFVKFFDWTELEVPEDSAITKTIYVKGDSWSSFPVATQLYFEAEYLNHASLLTTAVIASTEVLTDNTTWTALTVTFTPLQVGPVRYRGYLKCYASSCKVYVDNAIYTS